MMGGRESGFSTMLGVYAGTAQHSICRVGTWGTRSAHCLRAWAVKQIQSTSPLSHSEAGAYFSSDPSQSSQLIEDRDLHRAMTAAEQHSDAKTRGGGDTTAPKN